MQIMKNLSPQLGAENIPGIDPYKKVLNALFR